MNSTATALRFDRSRFRDVLGRFCTGVTIIAGVHEGQPMGFACQSFASLSLEPPLVSVAVAQSSVSGRRIEESGSFCATVLRADQAELCRRFGRSGADKFAGVAWDPAEVTGSPRVGGGLAWVDCRIESVVPAGDHRIVIGRVMDLSAPEEGGDGAPLLFYRGAFLGATRQAVAKR
ncbi:flavin reductase family protein [Streptomyces lydicus]|uniref:flavin reductase family protein n=1 Tax=Streptomyces lydicus TaxID=47763 RepID=UPI0010112C1A|nr:flavin reductase family protein [Streptomyces lydicus]MCZ1006984.1 flavin reductase family protein [Streptomyces lydicus]